MSNLHTCVGVSSCIDADRISNFVACIIELFLDRAVSKLTYYVKMFVFTPTGKVLSFLFPCSLNIWLQIPHKFRLSIATKLYLPAIRVQSKRLKTCLFATNSKASNNQLSTFQKSKHMGEQTASKLGFESSRFHCFRSLFCRDFSSKSASRLTCLAYLT